MYKIDKNDKRINEINPEILEILLIDRTSKKNIVWATNNYFNYGFNENDFITIEVVMKKRGQIVKPRISKSKAEQNKRSKDMAEVFTPAWICNKQNNIIDDEWFGYKNSFNIEIGKTWKSVDKVFLKENNWKEYVDLDRLEITCGEAPYLTSRYDVVSGNYIEPMDRIGILDRKLRVVTENAVDKDEWIEYAIISYKRTYGYDYQGDNVLIARENLLATFIEFYYKKFKLIPELDLLRKVAIIISWNIWQMDGLKFVVPYSCYEEKIVQLALFDEENDISNSCKGCKTGNIYEHNGMYSKIMNWRNNKIERFIDLLM